MFLPILRRAVVALSVLVASPLSAASVNLLTNGDFEAGNTGFQIGSPYVYTRINCCAGSVIVAPHINAAFSGIAAQGNRGGDHTTGRGLALFVNGSTENQAAFWRQTVNVTPGSEYTFGAWGAIWFGGNVNTALRINDVIVGTYLIDRFIALDVWGFDSLIWNSGSATSARIELVNLSTGFSGNDFAVDDLSFVRTAAPVPLPAGLPLLLAGLGGLALMRRRKGPRQVSATA